MLYPKEVEISQESIDRLKRMYQTAYKDIVNQMKSGTNYSIANKKQILRQVDVILERLGVDVTDFLQKQLPDFYKQGAKEAVKQLKSVGAEVPIKFGFNNIHQQSIQALVSDSAASFGDSMTGVSRTMNRLLSKTVKDLMLEKISTGHISGETLRNAKRTLVGTMQEDGLTALTDKSGKRWALDTYAEMLYRTKATESRNLGLINRSAENDHDLVEVSDHGSQCDLCEPWEGKILSITGNTPGYPTLDEATADGLFHPNCQHAINTYIPELADATGNTNPNA